jgi:hypothetical protein
MVSLGLLSFGYVLRVMSFSIFTYIVYPSNNLALIIVVILTLFVCCRHTILKGTIMDLPYIFKADVILDPELDLDAFIQKVT